MVRPRPAPAPPGAVAMTWQNLDVIILLLSDATQCASFVEQKLERKTDGFLVCRLQIHLPAFLLINDLRKL